MRGWKEQEIGMNQRELEREGMDLKLVLLLLLKKIPIVIITALAGALLCGTFYGAWHSRAAGRRLYEARSQYYITFEEIEDKTFFDYYYNGYTWNDLLSSDLILGYAMELLPEGYERNYVDDCVEAEILSDVRVLTTTVRAKDAAEVTLLQRAVEQAVVHYAEDGEKLELIEVIRSEEPVLEELSDHMLRAAATGAAGAALAAVIVILLLIAVQDAVYLPEELEKRFGVRCAGIECGNRELQRQLAQNEEWLLKGNEYPVLSMQEVLNAGAEVFARIRNAGGVIPPVPQEEACDGGGAIPPVLQKEACDGSGVILSVPQGKRNSRRLSAALHQLEIQDCKVIYAKITDADERLLRWYYGRQGNVRSSAKRNA